MTDALGDLGLDGPEALYAAANRVESGFIRTEADEVHYNLHILMRFDLERDLISGALAPADAEQEWNARFMRDFGRKVDRASNGVLQDVHWSVGLFGYFPTYSLGNIYAAELAEAMRRDLPGMDAATAEGDFAGPVGWMRSHIHVHGGLLPPEKLIEAATGRAPTEAPLLAYLNAKFGDLYHL
jgi:carboxypeptidase Taq